MKSRNSRNGPRIMVKFAEKNQQFGLSVQIALITAASQGAKMALGVDSKGADEISPSALSS
jgi:hypothetical protein